MRNRWTAISLLVVLALLASACDRLRGSESNATATPESVATLPPVAAGSEVVAEGKVVPVQQATLGFPTGGTMARVLVGENERVRVGQVLVRLDSARQAASVLQAQANLSAAQAQLAKLEAGATAPEIAAAEAAVTAAEAGVKSARGVVAEAAANAQKVDSGATWEELAIAERRVEEAKNALWGAQSRRDSICGRVPKYADQADCDGSRAAVQQAEEEVKIAELSLHELQAGARPEDKAAAGASVQQARGQLDAAEAAAAQSRAKLDEARAGPGAADLEAARAAVDQATAAVEQAELNLDDTELRAPFAGTVVTLSANLGETVLAGAPIVQLADLSAWHVETQDLTELNVVGISEGDAATLTFDAIPGLSLDGRVIKVNRMGKDRLGDIVYTVVVEPLEHDPRLMWNMTAVVNITTKDAGS